MIIKCNIYLIIHNDTVTYEICMSCILVVRTQLCACHSKWPTPLDSSPLYKLLMWILLQWNPPLPDSQVSLNLIPQLLKWKLWPWLFAKFEPACMWHNNFFYHICNACVPKLIGLAFAIKADWIETSWIYTLYIYIYVYIYISFPKRDLSQMLGPKKHATVCHKANAITLYIGCDIHLCSRQTHMATLKTRVIYSLAVGWSSIHLHSCSHAVAYYTHLYP